LESNTTHEWRETRESNPLTLGSRQLYELERTIKPEKVDGGKVTLHRKGLRQVRMGDSMYKKTKNGKNQTQYYSEDRNKKNEARVGA